MLRKKKSSKKRKNYCKSYNTIYNIYIYNIYIDNIEDYNFSDYSVSSYIPTYES